MCLKENEGTSEGRRGDRVGVTLGFAVRVTEGAMLTTIRKWWSGLADNREA